MFQIIASPYCYHVLGCILQLKREMSGINQGEDEIGNTLMSSAFSMEENERLAVPLKELSLFISASHVIFLHCCISKQGRSSWAENPAKKKFEVSHLYEKKS